MSVMTLDPEVFHYIRQGLEYASYCTQVDDTFYSSIIRHNRNKDIETECLRLVQSWAMLNMKSYCAKYYKVHQDDVRSVPPFYLREEYKEYLWFVLNEGDITPMNFRDWFDVSYHYQMEDNKDSFTE